METIFKLIEEANKVNDEPLEALAEYYRGKAEEHKQASILWLLIMLLSLIGIVIIILI